MLFVSEVANRDRREAIRSAYVAGPAGTQREADLGGASVRFDASRGVALPQRARMSFAVGAAAAPSDIDAASTPRWSRPRSGSGACSSLGRNDAIAMATRTWVRGDAPNAGEVFLAVATALDARVRRRWQGEERRARRARRTEMAIQGLSKRSGLAAGQAGKEQRPALTKAVANSFDPPTSSRPSHPLGGIDLTEIVNGVVAALDAPSSPQMLTPNFPDRVEASFTWKTTSRVRPGRPAGPERGRHRSLLSMNGRRAPRPDSATPRRERMPRSTTSRSTSSASSSSGSKLTFAARRARSPTSRSSCPMATTRCSSAGRWSSSTAADVASRRNGFSDPPALTVTPSGIAAGYSLDAADHRGRHLRAVEPLARRRLQPAVRRRRCR